jgi:hypothetical protein
LEKTTLCVTWSVFSQNGYKPAGMLRAAGEGPPGVKTTGIPQKADAAAGNAKISVPKQATCAMNRQRRVMTHRPYGCR